MYYLVHLALPALVVLVVAIIQAPPEITVPGLEYFALSYMAFAAPHWIWASVSTYFEATERTTVGGFVGLHLLLAATALIVFMSHSHEAANGWFLYFLGAPIAVALGGIAGRYVFLWKKS